MKRSFRVILTAAAILLSPAAFAESGQAVASKAKTAHVAKPAAVQAERNRQSFGAIPPGNAADGAAIARPPAQPGAW